MTALAVAIGFLLTEILDSDKQNSLGGFLMLIAQLLQTNADQAQLMEDKQNKEKENDKRRCEYAAKNTM